MNVVIISGAEATCKSDLAKRLATELEYNFLSKDVIKEAMYDELHQQHSTWDFNWYEARAKGAFFDSIESLADRQINMILESNFIGSDKKRLLDILGEHADIREVHCYTRGFISFKRAVRRNESGRRHPGHHDRRWYPKVFIQSTLRIVGIRVGAHRSVSLNDKVISLDTSYYPEIDLHRVISFVK